MRVPPPRQVLVERSVARSSLVSELRARLPAVRFEVVDSIGDEASADRSILEVVRFRGRFLKPCPGTYNYRCCGYQILHFGLQCTLGCTYCILQAYFQNARLRLFGNTGEMLEEVAAQLERHPNCLFRVGTGEFTDSLLLDPWTGFSNRLVPFFARQPNAVLELKTKTDHIDNLRDLDHQGHTIVAWSLNADIIRASEEPGATSIMERIAAASRCGRWGYRLAFHFDPMFIFPGWRQAYGEVLDRLFTAIDPAAVVWISLGAFRFMPGLKKIIADRHRHSRIVYGEFVPGLDGKMRYFRDLRVELYAFMADKLKRVDPELCVYLCMEGDDVWEEALGVEAQDGHHLIRRLDQAVKRRMRVGEHCNESVAEYQDLKQDRRSFPLA